MGCTTAMPSSMMYTRWSMTRRDGMRMNMMVNVYRWNRTRQPLLTIFWSSISKHCSPKRVYQFLQSINLHLEQRYWNLKCGHCNSGCVVKHNYGTSHKMLWESPSPLKSIHLGTLTSRSRQGSDNNPWAEIQAESLKGGNDSTWILGFNEHRVKTSRARTQKRIV